MQRRLSYALIALASSATLIAGCGGGSSGGGSTGSTGSTGGTGSNNSSQSPADELSSAFTNLGKAQTLTVAIHLDTDANTISGIASSSGSSLTSAQANAIAGAKLTLELAAPSGKTVSETNGSNGGAVDFTVSDNGTNWFTVRSVNKTLYIQADVKDVLNAVGQGATYAQLQQAVTQLPSFVQALFQGKWVSLPESAANSLTGGATGTSGNSQQSQQYLTALKQIVTNDVTVTRTTTGTTDKLQLTANTKKVATDFISTIETLVPQAGAALGSTDTSQIPNKDVTLGASVTGGALSQLSIDFGQFSPDPSKDHLPLVIDFAQSGPSITAPSGAVAVNTQELQQLFGSFAGSLGGTG
jgi:hypothetical protein